MKVKETEQLLYLLQKKSNKLGSLKEKKVESLAACDFSYSYFKYFETIYRLEHPTFLDITKTMNLSKPTVTIMVSKLIEKGLVQKTRSTKDSRVYYLSLTEKGNELASAYDKVFKNFLIEISTLYNKEEMKTLISLLNRI